MWSFFDEVIHTFGFVAGSQLFERDRDLLYDTAMQAAGRIFDVSGGLWNEVREEFAERIAVIWDGLARKTAGQLRIKMRRFMHEDVTPFIAPATITGFHYVRAPMMFVDTIIPIEKTDVTFSGGLVREMYLPFLTKPGVGVDAVTMKRLMPRDIDDLMSLVQSPDNFKRVDPVPVVVDRRTYVNVKMLTAGKTTNSGDSFQIVLKRRINEFKLDQTMEDVVAGRTDLLSPTDIIKAVPVVPGGVGNVDTLVLPLLAVTQNLPANPTQMELTTWDIELPTGLSYTDAAMNVVQGNVALSTAPPLNAGFSVTLFNLRIPEVTYEMFDIHDVLPLETRSTVQP